MMNRIAVFLACTVWAVTLWAAPALAQSTSSPSGCFTCDCNSQDSACRASCAQITEFVKRQQCEASCGQQQASCLQSAQALQRAADAQRTALQQQSTASGSTR